MNNLPQIKLILRFVFFLFVLIFVWHEQAAAQSLDLDGGFTGGVSDAPPSGYVSATQPDGKVLVGGLFHLTNGVQKPFLARLNTDGTVDPTFNVSGAGANSYIYDINILSDGKILISGGFTSYNGTTKSGLVRLNADGSLDPTFNAGGTGLSGTAQTIALQTDGKILISGSNITAYNGIARFSVIRVNSDGTLDTTFTSPFTTSQFVEGIAIQPNDKVVIGGVFSFYGSPYNNIVRLNSNGSIDTTFSPGGTDGGIYALSLQADGKFLIGGDFTYYQNNFRPKIARLNSDGSLDTSFNPGTLDGASAEYFESQTDGKILVAGKFLDFFNQQFSLIRLNANGSLDNTFQPLPSDEEGYNVKLQKDGKIILTGLFTQIGGASHSGIARLNSNGSVDSTFNASLSNLGLIDAIARQPDGKILVGGIFYRAGGIANFNIARFNQDGTLDSSFTTGTGTGSVNNGGFRIIFDIKVQTDGKILVGGAFSSFNNDFRPAIVRLNVDGSVDTSFQATFFDPTLAPITYDIFVQSDGKILVGGRFYESITQNQQNLVRLNTDGSVDSTFTGSGNGTNNAVLSITQQKDGKFIIGGSFTTYSGQPHSRLVRISANGILDSTFNIGSGANSLIWDTEIQDDGKVLAGGNFTTFNGITRNHLTRLNSDGSLDTTFNVGTGADNTVYKIVTQPRGKIIIGGFFSIYNGKSASRLARINPDGSLDSSFISGIINDFLANVRDILVQPDGNLIVGGVFSSYNGISRNSLLRLTAANIKKTNFDFDGDGKADISVFRPDGGFWYLLNSASGFTGSQFGVSTDKLVPADYDGDGVTDLAVYRGGTWYLQRSSAGFTGIAFGAADDVPQPADYDGDGKADLAVYRPSNGTWYIYNLVTNQFTSAQFGASTDKPVASDYNGDGKADYAVFRPSNGTWYIARPTGVPAQNFDSIQFGEANDKPVPADYDGDGKTDVAVYRPLNGSWYINRSQLGFTSLQFGISTDLPAPADYDGDGKADITVFRDGNWYLNRSTAGFLGIQFGAATDKPVPNSFVP